MSLAATYSNIPEQFRRSIVTPEGVPLIFQVASAGERAGAFILDSLFVIATLIIMGLLAGWMSFFTPALANIFFLCVVFACRQCYFIFFELRWQGRTPGKRIAGLRVIDRKGGPLSVDSVVARNLTRDIETLIPFVVMIAPEQFWPAAPGWTRLISVIWLGVLMFMPLFNRDRLRIGDMLGGTLVVVAPKSVLLEDLSASRGRGPQAEARYTFTREQLDMYGVYELQVLEKLLRQPKRDRKTLSAVCLKVKRKIAWDRSAWKVNPERFLEDFYTAQRARLEHKMLFGDRQEKKKEGRLDDT